MIRSTAWSCSGERTSENGFPSDCSAFLTLHEFPIPMSTIPIISDQPEALLRHRVTLGVLHDLAPLVRLEEPSIGEAIQVRGELLLRDVQVSQEVGHVLPRY